MAEWPIRSDGARIRFGWGNLDLPRDPTDRMDLNTDRLDETEVTKMHLMMNLSPIIIVAYHFSSINWFRTFLLGRKGFLHL